MMSTTGVAAFDVGLLIEADEVVWAALYDRYAALVYGYLWRRCGCSEDAADMTSETFTRALCAREGIHRDGSYLPGAWLIGFARNILHEHFREQRRLAAATARLAAEPDAERFDDPADIVEADVIDLTQRASIERAWAGLGPDDQDIITKKYLDQLTAAQIAGLLHIEPATVRKRLQRATGNLRAAVRGSLGRSMPRRVG